MSSRNNYLLVIEYDGTKFCGWQAQPGERSVQGEIEKAISKLGFSGVKAVAAGRTDKGAHAEGQAVSVSFGRGARENTDLRYGLNSLLPKDISVALAEKVNSSFNPRFEAKKKKYRYDILNRQWRSVWQGRNAWHVTKPLDTNLMRKASKYLLGRHDFSAFDAAGSTQDNKTADIENIDIVRRGGKISISFTGDRFLYKMVRNIVGTLAEAGRGRIPPERMREILSGKNRKKAGPTAPSKGLFLEEIEFYEKQKRKT